jgi:GGDEF domain-containing protein
VDPTTAIVIGTLEPSPLVWRWVRRAMSAGADIRRACTWSHAARYAAGRSIDLDMFERIDDIAAPASGDGVLVMLAVRHRGGNVVAGFSGDECVVLLPAVEPMPAEQDSAPDSAQAGRAWVALVGLAGRQDRDLSARATFARTGPPAPVPVGDRDARRLEAVR